VTLTAPIVATSLTGSYLTASEMLITNGSKGVVSAPVATYPSLTELTYVKGVTSNIQTQLDAKQPLDSDLTTIAGLTATTDNFIVSVSSAWASRTPAQVKTTLSLNNVDNTSDSTKNSATATLTNKSIGAGTLTLEENASIALDPAGSADGKYSGITIAGTAGATLAFGDVCYYAVADSRWELADATAAATGVGMIGICVLAAAANGSATTMLLQGTIRADTAFPALTVGAPVYLDDVAGDVSVAIPTGADTVIRCLGFALTDSEMYWNPSQDVQITVA
jgi:hypothetical protein